MEQGRRAGGPALVGFSQRSDGVPDRLEAFDSRQDDRCLQACFPEKQHGLLESRSRGPAGGHHVVGVVQACRRLQMDQRVREFTHENVGFPADDGSQGNPKNQSCQTPGSQSPEPSQGAPLDP